MSDRDEEESSKNVAPDHNLKNVKSDTDAPKGISGTAIPSPSPGLGTSKRTVRFFVDVEVEADDLPIEQQEDTRPIALKIGDAEVDAQSELDGQQLKTLEEIRSISEPKQELEGPKISRSDYAEAFQRATEQSLARQQSRDQDID